MNNLYVAIEGIDGSGKSTFLKELVNELNKMIDDKVSTIPSYDADKINMVNYEK